MSKRGRPPRPTGRRPILDLSIDFDFFSREEPLWDFGHNEEDPIFAEIAWKARYSHQNLYVETDPATYCDFTPDALLWKLRERGVKIERCNRLGYADSHVHAFHFFKSAKEPADMLLQLDAHHDVFGQRLKEVNCGNWLWHLMNRWREMQAVQVYPRWKNMADDGPPATDRLKLVQWADWPGFGDEYRVRNIFICRSGTWLPPHHDPAFVKLVSQLHEQCWKTEECEPMRSRSFPTEDEVKRQNERWQEEMSELEQLYHRRTGPDPEAFTLAKED